MREEREAIENYKTGKEYSLIHRLSSKHDPSVAYIIFWYLAFLGMFFGATISIIGQSTIISSAKNIRPYSFIFKVCGSHGSSKETCERIFFLGDSSVARAPWIKQDLPRIPAILQDELKKSCAECEKIKVIDWSFPGARLFHQYCLLFEAERYSPSLIIISVNWRNMSRYGEWMKAFPFSELSAQVPFSERVYPSGRFIFHLENISFLRQLSARLSQRPLLYLSGLRIFLRTKVGIAHDKPPDIERLKLLPPPEEIMSRWSDEQFFQNYANDIPDNNVAIRLLQGFTETVTRRHIKCLFYITPIHMQAMRKRRAFNYLQFKESVSRIIQSTTSAESTCLSFVELLDEDSFIDYFEHYTPAAEREIAEALAKPVHDLLCSRNAASLEWKGRSDVSLQHSAHLR